MKVKIDREKCIGCSECSDICPNVFELKDGKAYAREEETDKPCAKEAESICPVQAIKID